MSALGEGHRYVLCPSSAPWLFPCPGHDTVACPAPEAPGLSQPSHPVLFFELGSSNAGLQEGKGVQQALCAVAWSPHRRGLAGLGTAVSQPRSGSYVVETQQGAWGTVRRLWGRHEGQSRCIQWCGSAGRGVEGNARPDKPIRRKLENLRGRRWRGCVSPQDCGADGALDQGTPCPKPIKSDRKSGACLGLLLK